MKNLILIAILLIAVQTSRAANNEQQFDSIMNIMKDQSIPLLNRYYMTGAAIDYFPLEQQVEILKTLIPEAKQHEDKAVITRLYSIIVNHKTTLEDMEGAKLYLDSAFIYKDKFENNAIKGLMYFAAGHYYHDMNDVKQAHENYYESATYLQKLPTLPPLLTDIYYNLSGIYTLWGDENRLKELIENMKEVPQYHLHQPMLNNLVIGHYFNVQFRKYQQIELVDSIIKYNELAAEIETGDASITTKYQLTQNYISLVRAYIQKGNMEAARINLEIADKYAYKEKWSTAMQLNLIKSEFYTFTKEYDKAEESLNKAIELLNKLKEEQKTDYFYFYIEIYERLGQIYAEQKMYEKALTYEKAALEYRKRLFDKENSMVVNDLRTQYHLEEKERTVNQLTLLSERRKNINILAVVVLVLFLILIVQLVIRFRITRKANENKLKIEQMKRKESELEVELYKARQEEKENEFKIMQTEVQQRRVQSYLEGLEAARERLSRELHDNIQNELLALKMRIVESEKPEEIVKRLELLQAEVRAISHDLMPPVFQHAQFTEVLHEYISQWDKLSETQLLLTLDPEDESWDELPEEVNLGLYRIIQEAVGNALKHAKATQIVIILSRNADKITLTIQDNGKGFEVEGKYRGIGLKLIQERAKGLNGEAFIHSTPGKGTRTEVIITLK